VTRTRGEALRKVKSPPKFARAGRPSARRCAHSHRAHPCTRSASARHCRHLDAAHLSIPLHPSRDDVVLSDDDPPSLGATSPLAPARCDGAPPVPPAGAPARCPPGDPRWPPGAPLAPPSVTLSVPPGAARCRASVALSSHAWRRAARAHRTKPIFRFRYFCLIRARDEKFSSKCSRPKQIFRLCSGTIPNFPRSFGKSVIQLSYIQCALLITRAPPPSITDHGARAAPREKPDPPNICLLCEHLEHTQKSMTSVCEYLELPSIISAPHTAETH
jgi:hypothetical protein